MRRLAIPAHVHVCADGDHVVFLDLRKDRYWALPAVSTRGFAAQVGRWPVREAQDAPGCTADPTTLEALRAKGLLCEDAPLPNSPRAETVHTPARRDLLSIGPLAAPADTGHAASLVASAVRAAVMLKGMGLNGAVSRTRQRKQRQREAAAGPEELVVAAALVASFERLRPLLFSARDACLFNSFALIEFLARHDCHPHWVFGVHARPFAAHCWVQLDDVVLNDGVEHVSRYTPILIA